MNSDPLDPIPLSALQHWAYCPRQCALIHVEQVFEDNIFTQRGQALHKRVDDPGFEVRDGLRVERALPLFCDRLGLVGKGDVVEFLADGTPYPVEYKHGSPLGNEGLGLKPDDALYRVKSEGRDRAMLGHFVSKLAAP